MDFFSGASSPRLPPPAFISLHFKFFHDLRPTTSFFRCTSSLDVIISSSLPPPVLLLRHYYPWIPIRLIYGSHQGCVHIVLVDRYVVESYPDVHCRQQQSGSESIRAAVKWRLLLPQTRKWLLSNSALPFLWQRWTGLNVVGEPLLNQRWGQKGQQMSNKPADWTFESGGAWFHKEIWIDWAGQMFHLCYDRKYSLSRERLA